MCQPKEARAVKMQLKQLLVSNRKAYLALPPLDKQYIQNCLQDKHIWGNDSVLRTSSRTEGSGMFSTWEEQLWRYDLWYNMYGTLDYGHPLAKFLELDKYVQRRDRITSILCEFSY